MDKKIAVDLLGIAATLAVATIGADDGAKTASRRAGGVVATEAVFADCVKCVLDEFIKLSATK